MSNSLLWLSGKELLNVGDPQEAQVQSLDQAGGGGMATSLWYFAWGIPQTGGIQVASVHRAVN